MILDLPLRLVGLFGQKMLQQLKVLFSAYEAMGISMPWSAPWVKNGQSLPQNLIVMWCYSDDGRKFAARFATKNGYSTIRIPYTIFRSDWGGSDTLDGSRIVTMGFRYTPSLCNHARSIRVCRFENRGKPMASQNGLYEQPSGRFNLEVDWIKTLPKGKSTDFVLISCAGVPRQGVDVDILEKILISQRTGETMVRNSGVGYTIVRPTTLNDEPGGLKALIFDQVYRFFAHQALSSVRVRFCLGRACHTKHQCCGRCRCGCSCHPTASGSQQNIRSMPASRRNAVFECLAGGA